PQRIGKVRPLLVAGGTAGGPLKNLTGAIRRLAVLAQMQLQQRTIHVGQGSVAHGCSSTAVVGRRRYLPGVSEIVRGLERRRHRRPRGASWTPGLSPLARRRRHLAQSDLPLAEQ